MKTIASGTKVGNDFIKIIRSTEPGWIKSDLGQMLTAKVRSEILNDHGEEKLRQFNEALAKEVL